MVVDEITRRNLVWDPRVLQFLPTGFAQWERLADVGSNWCQWKDDGCGQQRIVGVAVAVRERAATPGGAGVVSAVTEDAQAAALWCACGFCRVCYNGIGIDYCDGCGRSLAGLEGYGECDDCHGIVCPDCYDRSLQWRHTPNCKCMCSPIPMYASGPEWCTCDASAGECGWYCIGAPFRTRRVGNGLCGYGTVRSEERPLVTRSMTRLKVGVTASS